MSAASLFCSLLRRTTQITLMLVVLSVSVVHTAAAAGASWPQCMANKLPANPTSLTLNPTWPEPWPAGTKTYTSGYLAFTVGPSPPACMTDAVIQRDLKQLADGILKLNNIGGFPVFSDIAKGHYFNWYALKTGLPGDTTAATTEGGGPGNRGGVYDFESTPKNVCAANSDGSWDTYESGGALHECIHAHQQDLNVYNNPASGWIHEAFNVYFQGQVQLQPGQQPSVGWLVPAVIMAQHIPIESFGFYTDGSVSGPSGQGGDGKTMPDYYGGYRYGEEMFPLSLGLTFGHGFVNCLWTTPAAGNQGSVFQTLQQLIGEQGLQLAVLNYGARSALLDFDAWSAGLTTQVQNFWNADAVVKTGRFFYTFPSTGTDGWLSPPANQQPHHQGRNIIPLVMGNADNITIRLQADATGNMGTPLVLRAMLAYRDANGAPVYSQPFSSGVFTAPVLSLYTGIVNLVLAVTNPYNNNAKTGYGFEPNEKFNYRVRIEGATVAPASTVPWVSAPAVLPCGSAAEEQTLSLACSTGKIVDVSFASFGVPWGTCGTYRQGTCHANNSAAVVKAACVGKSSCTVQASNSVFGDPCPGSIKKLSAAVTCGITQCVTVAEGNTATLSCPFGTISSIDFVSYGNPSGTCGNFKQRTCNAKNALSTVTSTCLGKSTCVLQASNALFGDPCAYTTKQLAVQVTCSTPENMCAVNNGGCGPEQSSTCTPYSDGTVTCACASGYYGTPPSIACKQATNQCASANGGCGDAASTKCTPDAITGAASCTCLPGYAGTPPYSKCVASSYTLALPATTDTWNFVANNIGATIYHGGRAGLFTYVRSGNTYATSTAFLLPALPPSLAGLTLRSVNISAGVLHGYKGGNTLPTMSFYLVDNLSNTAQGTSLFTWTPQRLAYYDDCYEYQCYQHQSSMINVNPTTTVPVQSKANNYLRVLFSQKDLNLNLVDVSLTLFFK